VHEKKGELDGSIDASAPPEWPRRAVKKPENAPVASSASRHGAEGHGGKHAGLAFFPNTGDSRVEGIRQRVALLCGPHVPTRGRSPKD